MKKLSFLVAAAFSLSAFHAQAQQFPTKPVTIIVPLSPGGATDILARTLATPMEKFFGQPVIVENKPGADTRIGARFVASAPPDGHTIGILSGSSVSWPLFTKDPGVDMFKDFTPLGRIVDGQLIIVANVKTPFNTMREMLDYAKKNPGKVTWSLPTRSGEPALYGYLIRAKAGVEMLDVNYKGSAPQSTAVISGEVDIGQFAPGRVQAMLAANQVKVLAISGNSRHPQFPNVPTMKEVGVDGIKNYDFGLFSAANTPAAIVSRLNAGMIAALKDPGVIAANAKFGFNPIGSTPAEHAADMKETFEDWKLAAKIGKVQPE